LKKVLLFLLFISAIPFFYQGCVPSKPIEEVEILPSERLINKLEANRRKIKNFDGVGTISIESELYDNSASFRVLMQKPDSIYFTILGPFGIELAQALVTNDDYVFYDALENIAYKGKVTDDVLWNIFKINLSFSDLLDAFVGSVNLTQNLYKQPDQYSVENEQYVLAYKEPQSNLTTTYHVDIRELGITNYSLKAEDGSVNLEGNYSRFELIDDVAIPFEIEIKNKVDNQIIKISYKDISVNSRGIKVKFNLPDDATIIQW